MKKIREVLRLRLGRKASIREIAAACGVGRSTVDEYVQRATSAGLSWPLPDGVSDEALTRLLFPAGVKGGPDRPVPEWNQVRQELSRKGVTLLLLWQEYKREHPTGYCYSRYVLLYTRWLKGGEVRMLQHHKAGEKVFVDWAGLKMEIADPKSGAVWSASVFVSALGLSQYIFARAYPNEQLEWWLGAHCDAFEFYGALPEIVVPDNPKTGVLKPCRYEPHLNPSYSELARFYEIAVIPARSRKPRDKAKVESAVQQVERWVMAPLRERKFFSLAEANEAIAGLVEKLNERQMKGPGLSRMNLFEREDLPAMRPLPAGRYSFAAWKRCKVAPDYHVEVDSRLYSVPFSLVSKHVDVRIGAGTIEVFEGGTRVASHLRSYGQRRFVTEGSHMPESHRKHSEWNSERIVRWAATVGPSTAAFVEAVLKGKLHPEQGFRSCMGVVSLERAVGTDRLEAACEKALRAGALSYGQVKSILDKNLEREPLQQELAPLPTHQNIRGQGYYTQESTCAN